MCWRTAVHAWDDRSTIPYHSVLFPSSLNSLCTTVRNKQSHCCHGYKSYLPVNHSTTAYDYFFWPYTFLLKGNTSWLLFWYVTVIWTITFLGVGSTITKWNKGCLHSIVRYDSCYDNKDGSYGTNTENTVGDRQVSTCQTLG